MALLTSLYNQTRFLLARGDINFSSLRFMLRNELTTFNGTHTVVDQLSGNEVSGNGWPVGGFLIQNTTLSQFGVEAVLSGDDIAVLAQGGPIGPASSGVLIGSMVDNPSDQRLLLFMLFSSQKQAIGNTTFSVLWDEDGIIRWFAP